MSNPMHPWLVRPRDGESVDARAVELEWATPGAGPDTAHHLQVSGSERFDTLIVDTMVGASTSLQLHGVLLRDGRRIWWRVSARKGDWSDPASFLAAAPVRRVPGQRSAAATGQVVALPPDAPPYLTGTTAPREVGVALAVLLAVVIFLLALLAPLAP